jgi:hypothetical protein
MPRRSLGRALVIPIVLASSVAIPAGVVAEAGADPRALAAVPLSACYSADNGDPWLTGLTVAPASLDVRGRAKSVLITATAEDTGGPGEPTGIGSIRVGFAGHDVELARGDDNVWRGTHRFVVGSRPGGYAVSFVWVTDQVGNYRVHTSPWLRAQGYRIDVEVDSRKDRGIPELSDLQLSRTTVDTRAGTASVRVTAWATDDVAGVASVLVVAAEEDPGYREGDRVSLRRTSGTARDGRWTGRLHLRGWTGTMPLDLYVSLEDRVGQSASYSAEQLSLAGFDSDMTVLAHTDTAKPTLTNARATPAALDLEQEDGGVVLRVRVTDGQSGVGSVFARVRGPGANQSVRLKLNSGDRASGIWQRRLPYGARCHTRAGAYEVRLIAIDRSGRISRETATFTLTGPDRVRPFVRLHDANKLTVGSVLRLTFTEDVTGLSDQSAVIRPPGGYRRSTNLPSPGAPGTWTCADSSGASVDCFAGALRSATWTPTGPLQSGASYFLDFNPEHVRSLTDLAGNPLDDQGIWTWEPTP